MQAGILDQTMSNPRSNPLLRTPFGQVELRPVTPPAGAPEGMRVYVLLPDLDELLGVPGFGLRDPILVRGGKLAPVISLLLH
jgi:hypothetical protein